MLNFCDGSPDGFCGYHSTLPWVTAPGYKYALVPNPAGKCDGSCSDYMEKAPNGDIGMDSMISTFAHELTECISDEDQDAWLDSSGSENADKCVLTYGTTKTTASGYPSQPTSRPTDQPTIRPTNLLNHPNNRTTIHEKIA